jgi:hypothetical protein
MIFDINKITFNEEIYTGDRRLHIQYIFHNGKRFGTLESVEKNMFTPIEEYYQIEVPEIERYNKKLEFVCDSENEKWVIVGTKTIEGLIDYINNGMCKDSKQEWLKAIEFI